MQFETQELGRTMNFESLGPAKTESVCHGKSCPSPDLCDEYYCAIQAAETFESALSVVFGECFTFQLPLKRPNRMPLSTMQLQASPLSRDEIADSR